eukprot:11933018-Karenia_brevis.AAC.1
MEPDKCVALGFVLQESHLRQTLIELFNGFNDFFRALLVIFVGNTRSQVIHKRGFRCIDLFRASLDGK